MKKVIRLTESDLTRIVKRVISNYNDTWYGSELNKNLSESPMNADSDKPTNSPIYRLYNSLVKDLGFKHISGTLSGAESEPKAIYVKYVPRPKKKSCRLLSVKVNSDSNHA